MPCTCLQPAEASAAAAPAGFVSGPCLFVSPPANTTSTWGAMPRTAHQARAAPATGPGSAGRRAGRERSFEGSPADSFALPGGTQHCSLHFSPASCRGWPGPLAGVAPYAEKDRALGMGCSSMCTSVMRQVVYFRETSEGHLTCRGMGG